MAKTNPPGQTGATARGFLAIALLATSVAVIAMPDPRPWWSSLALLAVGLPYYALLLLQLKRAGLMRATIPQLMSANLLLPAVEVVAGLAFVVALALTPLPSL